MKPEDIHSAGAGRLCAWAIATTLVYAIRAFIVAYSARWLIIETLKAWRS